MALPDVPQQDYDQFQAGRFTERNTQRINDLNLTSGFLQNSGQKIANLGYEPVEAASLSSPILRGPGGMPMPQPGPPPQLPGMPQLPGVQLPQMPWQQQSQQGPTTPPAQQAPTQFSPVLPAGAMPTIPRRPQIQPGAVTTPLQPEPEPSWQPIPRAQDQRAGARRIGAEEPTWVQPGSEPLGRTYRPPTQAPSAPLATAAGGQVNPQPVADEVRQYIIQAAQARGIDPDVALKVAQSEGGFEAARRGTFNTGSSWWPFQLHYGGKGYEHLGTKAGMGNTFTAETGYAPGDPNAWQAATDYALDRAKSSGWGAWYGAKAQGITGFTGIDRNAPSRPTPQVAGTAALPHAGEPATATDSLGDKWKTQFDFGATYTGSYRTGTPHRGIDLVPQKGGIGTPIEAFQPGTVSLIQRDSGGAGGLMVYVQDEQGLTHAYMHLAGTAPGLKVGDPVGRGQQIAYMGESGTEGSPHLHYEVRRGLSGDPLDKLIDPRPYMQQGGQAQTVARQTPSDDDVLQPDFLDRQREQMRSSLAEQTAFQRPTAVSPYIDTAQQARRTGGEVAHLPRTPVAKSENPLEELGNTIGSAIQSALSAALGGGGPPGGEDRRREAEGALERLRRSPFPEEGRAAEDIVGRTTGMYLEPPQDIREAVERAMTDVERRGVPSPGPGGALGILRPGKSLRELNPFSKGPEGSALDYAMGLADEVNRLRTVAATATGETATAARRALGGMLPSNVDTVIPEVADAMPGVISAGTALSRSRPKQAWDNFVRNFTDENVDLNHVQEEFARRAGRRLRDDEMVAFLARVDPSHRALVSTENAIGPALRAVPDERFDDFKKMLDLRASLSRGEGQAKKAEREYLEGGISPRTEAQLKEAMDDWTRMQDELDEAESLRQQVAQGNVRTRESISLDAANARVETARARAEGASEVARQTQTERARAEVMEGPGARVVTLPEKRDLDIAENDLKRLQRRFDRLYERDPDDLFLDKLAREMGRMESRLVRQRTQLGATSAAREQQVLGRAQRAADVAAARPTVTPTAEFAAARMRLQYEQQNLQRLQDLQARGAKGLADDVARAKKRLDKAQADVEQAQKDLPEAARAQGWAQRSGLQFGTKADGTPRRYEDLQRELAELRARIDPEELAVLDSSADSFFNFSRELRDEMVDSGAWTREMADEMDDLYKDWLPTEVLDHQDRDEALGGMKLGERLSVGRVDPYAYTAEGHTGETEDRITSQLRNADKTYRIGAKTRAVRALIAAQGDQPGGLQRIAPDMKTYEANPQMLPPSYKPKPGQGDLRITAVIDGEKQQWVTDNPLLHAAIEKAPSSELKGLFSLMGKGASLTREVAVSRNPGWLALNTAKDLGTYLVTESARGGLRGNVGSVATNLGPAAVTAQLTEEDDPERQKKIAAALAAGFGTRTLAGKRVGFGPNLLGEYLRALPDVFQGVATGRYGGAGTQEFLLGGGGMRGGGVFGSKAEDVEDSLRRLRQTGALQIRDTKDFKNIINNTALFGWVKTVGDRIELAPRVAAMRTARERGASPLESVIRGRNVTIDFDRGGSWIKAANKVVPFLNASTQGVSNIMRLAKDHPGGFLLAGASLVGAPALHAEAHNHSTPELERDYADVPDYVKRMGIVIMLGGEPSVDKNGNRMPNYFLVPTLGFMPFVEAAREGFARTTGREGRSAGELALTTLAENSPIQFTNPADIAFGTTGLPGVSQLGQLHMNRDLFRGTTIASERTNKNASALARAVAEPLTDVVSRLPGQEAARIQPSQIDWTIRDLLGGPGQAALGASNLAAQYLAGEEPRSNAPSEVPLVGGSLGRFVRTAGGQRMEEQQEPGARLRGSVREQLRDAGIYWEPAQVSSSISDVPLRYAEQEELQRLTNQYVNERLERLVDMDVFKNATPEFKKVLIERISAPARELARKRVLASIPPASRAARKRSGTSKE